MEDIYISAEKLGLMLGIGARSIERYKSGYGVISAYKHYVELLKGNIEDREKQINQLIEQAPTTRLNLLKVQKLEAEVRERNAISRSEALRDRRY